MNVALMKKDRETYFRENIRGGNGALEMQDIFPEGVMPNTVRLMTTNIIKKGQSIGLHEHVEEGELFMVLEGEIIVTQDGKDVVLKKYDATWTEQAGSIHGLRNEKDEDAVVLFLILRLPEDVRDPEWVKKCPK